VKAAASARVHCFCKAHSNRRISIATKAKPPETSVAIGATHRLSRTG
jgi:hypothetical protein